MYKTKLFHSLLALLLLFSVATSTFAQVGNAQGQSAAAASSYAAALSAIEGKTDARRKELGIPGMSLVIVKDDQVIYSKGLGYKDFENKVPVTADTQFAIGSSQRRLPA